MMIMNCDACPVSADCTYMQHCARDESYFADYPAPDDKPPVTEMPIMQFVYVIENETDVMGVWSTPEKAVRAYYHEYIDDNGMISGDALYGGESVSMEDMIKTMSADCADYPILRRVPLDGTKAGYGGNCWYRDC